MADYDIFRQQLGSTFPKYGHALWDPSPRKPDRPVKVGDVGFIRMGKFHCLFNILCPKSERDNVPEGYEPLVLRSPDHITESSLTSGHYCSPRVSVEVEQDTHISSPDDPREVSIKCSGRQGGALLSLPVNARREDTLAQSAFGEWMVKHIDRWFAFARDLQQGVQQMEDIILITGCDRTRSWTNIAFLEGQIDTKGSYKVKAVENANIMEVQYSSGQVAGGVLSHGPRGANLPENQCVFIRGFRMARTLRILPRHLKAAAGPSPEPEGYDFEPGTELVSIPATTEYRDPLHVLQDYVAERASDCDLVLVHDDDLERIDGIGEGTSLESLRPEAVMDLLRKSNIEIYKVRCDLSPVSSSPNIDTGVVWVAMLSTLFKNWDITLPSQLVPDMVRKSELSAPLSPILPDRISEPHFQNAMNFHDSAVLDRLGADEDIAPRLRNVIMLALRYAFRECLSNFAQLGRRRLVPAVVVAYCMVSLLRWTPSSPWDVIFGLFKFFTFLSVNLVLAIWFGHKNMHPRGHVSVPITASNGHEFIPPTGDDSRSPCPALNALANHSILPHNGRDISAFQLISVLREHYHISLPLAFLLSFGGTFMCGRYLKIDLHDLARHNRIEHDGSLTHADTIPGGLYAPVHVDKDLLQHLLDVSKDCDFLSIDDFVAVRAARDATLSRPLSGMHNTISRVEIAMTVQLFGDSDGHVPKRFIEEWFGDQRLPCGWFKPTTAVGFLRTTRIVNWVGKEVEKRLSVADLNSPEARRSAHVHDT